jgi:type IV pilus assembly protein PilA
MSDDAIWYYGDASGRNGPMTADALRAGLANGAVPTRGLFWRPGLAEWVPLSAVATELGVPVPPAMHDRDADGPKKGMSGCLIAVLVAVGLMVFVVPILAAIAISQYQDYVTKSQFSEAPSIVDGLKGQVVEAYTNTGACPVNGEAGFASAEQYSGKYVERIELGGTAPACTITVTFRGEGVTAPLKNQSAVFTGTDVGNTFQWRCAAPDIADKYLPRACQQ